MRYLMFLGVMFVFFDLLPLRSQSIGNIKLEWNYSGSLDDVLKAIGDDYNVKFVYDTLRLQNLQVKYYAFEENRLKQLFQEWKNRWNIYCYLEKKRTVIVSEMPLKNKERKRLLKTQ